jgi:uncharacterized glyoxalase superfamily protein PhnB
MTAVPSGRSRETPPPHCCFGRRAALGVAGYPMIEAPSVLGPLSAGVEHLPRALLDAGLADAMGSHSSKTAAPLTSYGGSTRRPPKGTTLATNAGDRLPNIFPEIVYDDAAAAVEWLARAFGFTLGELIPGPGETIAHAELHYGPGTIMVKSATTERLWGSSPRTLGGINQSVFVAVADPDAHHERAQAAGAEIIMAPTDMDFGARNYAARDPEGHVWGFGTYWPRDRRA